MEPRRAVVAGCAHTWKRIGHAAEFGLDLSGCERPQALGCEGCGEVRAIACGSARESLCQGCARVYVGRVGRVAGSGLVLGHLGLFITITAPGAAVHHDARGRRCRCTPAGGVNLETWNATAVARCGRFLRDLGRKLGVELRYFKAVEVQRRGALHFHMLIRRADGLPLAITRGVVRELALRHGFGHSVDVQRLRPENAGYVAKYVAKAADSRRGVPWRGVRRRGFRRLRDEDGRIVGYVQGRQETSFVATYRTWSASREWGQSMAAVKAAQQHHVLVLSVLPSWGDRVSVPGSWRALADIPARPDLEPATG